MQNKTCLPLYLASSIYNENDFDFVNIYIYTVNTFSQGLYCKLSYCRFVHWSSGLYMKRRLKKVQVLHGGHAQLPWL